MKQYNILTDTTQNFEEGDIGVEVPPSLTLNSQDLSTLALLTHNLFFLNDPLQKEKILTDIDKILNIHRLSEEELIERLAK